MAEISQYFSIQNAFKMSKFFVLSTLFYSVKITVGICILDILCIVFELVESIHMVEIFNKSHLAYTEMHCNGQANLSTILVCTHLL